MVAIAACGIRPAESDPRAETAYHTGSRRRAQVLPQRDSQASAIQQLHCVKLNSKQLMASKNVCDTPRIAFMRSQFDSLGELQVYLLVGGNRGRVYSGGYSRISASPSARSMPGRFDNATAAERASLQVKDE